MLSYKEYAAIEALNWSRLKHIDESPFALVESDKRPREDTDALILGRAIHSYVLTPAEFLQDFYVEPEKIDGRTKEGKAQRAEILLASEGKTVLTATQGEITKYAGKALSQHKHACKMLEGKREKVMTWTDPETGILCKGRPDVSARSVVDLKSTRMRSLRKIIKEAAEHLYHGQCAWYHAGLEFAGERLPDLPSTVFVQSASPFDVAVLTMTEETFLEGFHVWRSMLDKYQGCLAANWWPGMAPEVVPWDLPRWAITQSVEP